MKVGSAESRLLRPAYRVEVVVRGMTWDEAQRARNEAPQKTETQTCANPRIFGRGEFRSRRYPSWIAGATAANHRRRTVESIEATKLTAHLLRTTMKKVTHAPIAADQIEHLDHMDCPS